MKKKRLSVSVADDRRTTKVVGVTLKVSTSKVRNPIAANPLLGTAARHKSRKSRQGESRANIRQALKRTARGQTKRGSSDDWQNSSSSLVAAVLPVIAASYDAHQNVAYCHLRDSSRPSDR